jgi:steroid delta-isomerase-like uncharacterized protein
MDDTLVETPVTQVATPPGHPTPVSALTPEAVTALMTTFLEATNRRDGAALAVILAPGYLHHWPLAHETVGAAGYLANLQHVAEVFPDLTVRANQIFASDDFGAMVWTATGTQRQPFLGFPPCDHPATWTGLFLHRLAGGQIAETWTQADHLSCLQQQGALNLPVATPAPTPPPHAEGDRTGEVTT